ncbi:dGTP triphosphohydrolase [Cardiobacterium hominis]|uniref:dGTP triphosphohydrolase n=1 Tax=Cardiobacterium hominis TaxID=2718 RepID=UPI0028E75BA5|nr:dNTP triphosphohydrolase [Cardiobacterium hominis]
MKWEKLLNTNRLRESNRDITTDIRNEVESDLGRIIFSPATRRMHDKTQVFPLTTNDNIHTRLTHSMEVMSLGYSFGVSICDNPVFLDRVKEYPKENLIRTIPTILKNSCLLHDIGNPPFGHFGETVIQQYFQKLFLERKNAIAPISENETKFSSLRGELSEEQKMDFTYFDGNAQGLRVVTALQYIGDQYGLNLTYATLASIIKYPYTASDIKIGRGEKLGVFYTEVKKFDKIVNECGLQQGNRVIRHPLCYLMEASDSICYLTMDIEDGFYKGLFDFHYLFEKLHSLNLFNSLKSEKNWKKELERINNLKLEDQYKIIKLRTIIIQWFMDLASNSFIKNIDKIEAGNFQYKELIEDEEEGILQLSNKLREICKEKIFTNRDIVSLELTGHAVLTGLLDYYIEFLILDNSGKYKIRAKQLISKGLIDVAIAENDVKHFEDLSPYARLKLIVDYISGMTDKFALTQYQQLNGQKII